MNERELLESGYRKYSGEKIDVYFKKDICQHSGKCVHGSPQVFDVERKPWIMPLSEYMDQICEVIKTCPSGALKYKLADSDEILP